MGGAPLGVSRTLRGAPPTKAAAAAAVAAAAAAPADVFLQTNKKIGNVQRATAKQNLKGLVSLLLQAGENELLAT